jgi:uncharacterized OB-fold protein
VTDDYDGPLPNLDAEPYARPFWEAAREEELRVQECRDCGERQQFPRPWCRNCAGESFEWIQTDGLGRVHSVTVVRHPIKFQAFADDTPYALANVNLEAGVRMFTMVTDCDVDAVEPGLPVEVVFDHVTDDVTLPKFRPR